jgi:hypothetical protein
MSHDETTVTVSGTIQDIFAHRFVVQTTKGKILADFGKHNMGKIILDVGDGVALTGEQKTSELKIHKMTLNAKDIELEPKDKGHFHHEYMKSVDPEVAIHAAQREHVTVIGKPHRKLEHFEVLGKNPQGELVELHIELDGKLRKSKPVKPDNEKWVAELPAT